MRHFFAFLCLLLIVCSEKTAAQIGQIPLPNNEQQANRTANKIKQHATWKLSFSPEKPEVGETAELIIEAEIEEGWYLYSSDFDPDLGPIVTAIQLKKSDSYQLVGKLLAVHPKKKFDEVWGADITYFIGKAEFRQKIQVTKANPVIEGTIEYQTCTIKDGACVSGEHDLNFLISTKLASILPNENATEATKLAPPKEKQIEKTAVKDSVSEKAASQNNTVSTASTPVVKATVLQEKKEVALWMFFLQAFLFGLAGLVTPCVFPMVPMTVTFFTKNSKTHAEAVKKGLFYGLSIIFIYTVVGTLVAVFFGADAANFISTHWLPNVFFFIVFVIFASSFLGLFEIELPHWLVNKADEQSDKGGLIGIFFMAVTIVVVSFSCTGPIVGTVLIESAGGKFAKPIIGMLGFSLGFSIPFTLFAMFPSWLKSLPRSGGWLNSVKVCLGFLELALAMKFLSQADQVYHWGILDREVFIALWIVIFALLGLYLIRKIKLSHDDADYSEKPVSVPRVFFAVASFAFVAYLVPGMFGAPLKALSGYLPPLSTSDFVLGTSELSVNSPQSSVISLCEAPKYKELFHLPHGIQGYYDLKQAQNCAKAQNKPLFIDFTGHGCANCREMEASVWSDPAVLDRLKKDFVVVSLYVDERQELPQSEWYVSPYDGKEKTSIGKQNSDLEIRLFNNNAQPLYVIADPNVDSWLEPRAFDRNVQKFVDFLEEGKEKYRQ